MDFLDASQFPDRPDHPDFWELAKAAMRTDARAAEDHIPIPEIVGEFADFDSVLYMAQQRIGQMFGMNPKNIPPDRLALYLDAFTLGARYQADKP